MTLRPMIRPKRGLKKIYNLEKQLIRKGWLLIKAKVGLEEI